MRQLNSGADLSELIPPILLGIVVILFFYFRNNLYSESAKENMRIGDEFLQFNSRKANIITTKSGLQYELLEKGKGNITPNKNNFIQVNYVGKTLDGLEVIRCDNGLDRPSIAIKELVPGWIEGVELMKVGDKIRFFMPAKLTYKHKSFQNVEAGSLFIYDIELLSINSKS